MDLSQVITLINQLSLEKRGKGLRDANKLAIRAAWEDIFYREAIDRYCGEKKPSETYLSNTAGKEIWDLLSEVYNDRITKKTFRVKLLDLEKQGVISFQASPTNTPESLPQQLPIRPLPHYFGYEEELENGLETLQQSGILIVSGVAKSGKSAYCAKLIQLLDENNYDSILWKSLHSKPEIDDVIHEWSHSLGIQDVSISGLIQFCSSHRCLIVLDQAEQIMSLEDLSEDYISFLQRFIEEQNSSSCIMATNSSFEEIIDWQDLGYPIQEIILKGLDRESARALLEHLGLKDEGEWDGLIDKYRGNPYALINVSRLCLDNFGGSLKSYLASQSTWIGTSFINAFDQLLDLGKSQLNRKIIEFLNEKRKAVPIDDIIQELIDLGYSQSSNEILTQLNSLVSQHLVERIEKSGKAHFHLPPLTRKFVQVNPDALLITP